MLFKIIDNIRAKPEHIRRNIAFLTAGIISFVIFAVWFSGLSARLSGAPEAESSGPSPFSVIVEQGKAVFTSLSGHEVFEDVRSSVSAGANLFSDVASSTQSEAPISDVGTSTPEEESLLETPTF